MTLLADDPGSLDRLHDIVLPPPVPWWPPAPAWYVLGAIAFVLVATLLWCLIAWWARNRYRREALAELANLQARAASPRTLPALAELVKRVALVAFPREKVASLSGRDWLAFLNRNGRTNDFTDGPGATLEAGYQPGLHPVSPELFVVVRHWIKDHRATASC